MKLKMFSTIVFLMACRTGFAGSELPFNYSLNCEDGSFAYNKLVVKSDNDNLIFISSSQDIGIYKSLLGLSDEENWGDLRISASVRLKSCKVSSVDSKVVACRSESLVLEAKGTVLSQSGFSKKIELKNVEIKIRKVDEVAFLRNHSTGYELTVTENHRPSSPVFTQKYFGGIREDETFQCKLQ